MRIRSAAMAAALTWTVTAAGARAADEVEGAAAALEQAQPADQCQTPVSIVAQFLELAPPQVQALQQLLQQREEALAPIHQQIAVREQMIRQLVAGGGPPAQIGQLVLEVHQLRQAAGGVQAQFLTQFDAVLHEPQRQRWQSVRMAAQLQPVVPAFQALRLL